MKKSMLVLIIGILIVAVGASGCISGDTDSDNQIDTQTSSDNDESGSSGSSSSSSSSYPKKTCTECGGTGICWGCDGYGYDEYGDECIVCGGSGECPACLGSGWMSTHQNG